MSTRAALTEVQLRRGTSFLQCLQAFTKIRGTMPMQYAVSFMLVALDEGRGVGEYAERAGVSQSVMSRHLLDIGERNRYMQDGFGLVTYRANPMELRKHEYFLTPKGRALFHEIIRNMEK